MKEFPQREELESIANGLHSLVHLLDDASHCDESIEAAVVYQNIETLVRPLSDRLDELVQCWRFFEWEEGGAK